MILRDVKVLRLTAIAFLIHVDEVARNMAQATKTIEYTQYTSTQREVNKVIATQLPLRYPGRRVYNFENYHSY